MEEKKTRKRPSGEIRDKSRTMAKMVKAVESIIEQKGYAGLTAPNIAREAGVDKKLVWAYFGGTDNLIATYIRQSDFWEAASDKEIADLLKNPNQIGQKEIGKLLINQFETFFADRVLQKIILWELVENNKILKTVAQEREDIGEQLFEHILPEFEKSNIDLRARFALLISGIYYLSLHAKNNGSTFCGIDINKPEEKERIKKAIKDLVNEAYEKR